MKPDRLKLLILDDHISRLKHRLSLNEEAYRNLGHKQVKKMRSLESAMESDKELLNLLEALDVIWRRK